MSRTRTLLAVVAIAGIAVAALAVWWWASAKGTQSVVAQAVPDVPDLTSATVQARDAIHAADARARSATSARKGLAELSRVYHANGFLDAAVRCYEGLEQIEPSEPRWPHRHAIILAGFGEIEPAMILWRRVVQLAPDYPTAQVRLADALLKINRIDEASAAYQDVLKRFPTNPHAQLGLARIDFEAQRWDQARARLEPLVAQTNYELGYDLIVSLYERLGEHARAGAIRGAMKASGAYRDPPDPWMDELLDVCFDPYRLSVAAGLMAKEAAAKSAALLERAIQLAPNDVSNYYQLGMLALHGGDINQARRLLEKCTTLAPEFADGWAQLSGLLAQVGDSAGAGRTLAEGLSHCPKSPGLHLMNARNLKDAGRVGEAVREFKISAELRPNEADAYLELGNMLIGLGRNEEGIEQIQLAVQAEPGNPFALGILAFSAVLQGDEPEARRWFARAQAQPRVHRDQLEAIRAAFENQFGHSP